MSWLGLIHWRESFGELLSPPSHVTKQISFACTEALVCFLAEFGGTSTPSTSPTRGKNYNMTPLKTPGSQTASPSPFPFHSSPQIHTSCCKVATRLVLSCLVVAIILLSFLSLQHHVTLRHTSHNATLYQAVSHYTTHYQFIVYQVTLHHAMPHTYYQTIAYTVSAQTTSVHTVLH